MKLAILPSLACSLLLLACPASHAAEGAQLVQNASFDEDLTHWVKGGVGECPLEIFKATLPDGRKVNALRALPTSGPERKPWDNTVSNTLVGTLNSGQKAAVSFWARSPETATIHVSMQPRPGAAEKIWGKEIQLGKEWQHYEFPVDIRIAAEDGQGRLQFTIGYQEAPVEIALPAITLAD